MITKYLLTSTGKTLLHKTSGFASLDTDARPIDDKTIFRLASSTKLLTTIAALQCVERGQVTLDEPVYAHLPEFKDKQVISSSLGSNPFAAASHSSSEPPEFKLANTTKPISLRRLLTHTSGIGYDGIDPTLQAWRKSRNEPSKAMSGYATGIFDAPLIFEPGSSWMYGAGHDVAGVLVSRLNGNMGLEAYTQQNIFEPLGSESCTFFIRKKEDGLERLVQCVTRTKDSEPKLVPFPDPTGDDAAEEQGGGGMYSTITDYIAVLVDLLQDQSKLLRKESVDLLFAPQLEEGSSAMNGFQKASFLWGPFSGGAPSDAKINHSLGGLVIKEGLGVSGNARSSLQWAGGTGTLWMLERERGIAAFYGTQIFPPMDEKATTLRNAFMKEAKRLSS